MPDLFLFLVRFPAPGANLCALSCPSMFLCASRGLDSQAHKDAKDASREAKLATLTAERALQETQNISQNVQRHGESGRVTDAIARRALRIALHNRERLDTDDRQRGYVTPQARTYCFLVVRERSRVGVWIESSIRGRLVWRV